MVPGPPPWQRLLIVIIAVAAALRVFPVWFGLPYPHARPDEGVAVGHAMNVLAGDFNPGFFHWPSLTFYLFAAVFAVASLLLRALTGEGTLPPETTILLARSVVASAGTFTVLVLFHLGRRIAGTTTGLLAAACLSVAILHVRDSHFAMTDVLMTFFVTACMACLARAIDTPADDRASFRTFAAAGFLGGLAASTKYNAGAVAVAAGAAQLLWLWRFRTALVATRTWTPALAFLPALAAGFLIATPFAVLDSEKFTADLIFDFTHLSTGHGINLGRGWIYHLTHSLPYGAGLVTFAAAVAGIVPMLRHHAPHAFLIAAFCAATYAALGSGYTVFFRYVLPLIPFVCLSAAVAVRYGAAWIARRSGFPFATTAAALAALVVLPGLVNSVWFDVLLARTDTRVLAGAWLAARLAPGETVHDAGGDYARLELGRIRFHYWYYDPDAESFGHPEGRTPDWLVLTQSPLRTYANASAALRRLASERYELMHLVRGTRGAAGSAVYDLQDSFFMPLSDFRTVERPGPTILIYRRRDAPPLRGPSG